MAFITSLRIKNFFSIKDEVTIDFKASPYNIENNPERLFEFNGEYYNKVISFYGANASGKTSILKALALVASVISNENSQQDLISFKNKFSSITSLTEIEVGFVLSVGGNYREFIYKVKFEANRYENHGIKDEQLYEIVNGKEIIGIDRGKRIVAEVDKNILEGVFNNLSKNKSLLEECYKFEKTKTFEEIYGLFNILARMLNVSIYQSKFNTTYKDQEIIGGLLDVSAQHGSELESFFVSFFQSIGLDIIKIRVNFKEKDGEAKEFIGIEVLHGINEKEFLELDLESDGTQMLMRILMYIFAAKGMGTPLIIDEFDSILHPILIPIINNLLIENDIQIIYSTHNIYNMQFLQNDEIFLIEKDSNHKTTIKAVKDNPDIKGYKNLLTLYENGYLGGLPNVKEILTKIL